MAQITIKILGETTDIDKKIATIKKDLADIGKIKFETGSAKDGIKGIGASAQQAAADMAKATSSMDNSFKLTKQNIKETENGIKSFSQTYSNSTDTTVKLTTKYGKTVEQVKETTKDYTKQMQKQADAAENAARKNKLLGDSFSHIVAKITAWQTINGAVATVVRSLREAVQTMREVDDALVTIRKVTGFSDSQINQIRQQAYSTASAYGVGAADYLDSVAAFSRAGYREQAAALAELSTKTQIVGDTTAETANQFLLSVDAAYKYKGSVEELSKVLDGANELDNKYATSIEKIAEGMGIVAPVAEQMHVSIGELAAAIGTITAVTQRSGSEAARALRALFLNIAGDTKTEIDEGVKWTAGEISGLRDVIKLYAKDAYDAAQATGSIIDPMKAMEGLAKSMQEGVLTEQRLIEMVSDIGGKLRTSQLLAIIQNWDMYQSMLQDYAGAIGSADKEVQNALDSWTRKTNILKNTWAEFLQNFINSGIVKAAISGLTGLIKIVDSGFAKFALTIAAATAAVALLHKGITALFSTFTVQVILATAETLGWGTALKVVFQTLAQNPLVWVATATAAVYGLVKLFDALNVTAEEHLEKADKAYQEYQSLKSEIGTLNSKVEENNRLIDEGNRLGKDEAYLTRLKNENVELEKQIHNKEVLAQKRKEESNAEAQAAWRSKSYTGAVYDENGNITALTDLTIEGRIRSLLYSAQSGMDVNKELVDLFDKLDALLPKLDERDKKSAQIIDTINELFDLWDALTTGGEGISEVIEETEDAAEATEKLKGKITGIREETYSLAEVLEDTTDCLKEYNTAVDDVQSALDILNSAQQEYNENGHISVDTLQQLLSLDAEYLAALIDENGQINLNSDAISILIDGKKALLEKLAAEAIANYAAAEAQNLLNDQLQEAGVKAETAGTKLENAASAALRSGQKAAKGAAGWFTLVAATRQLAGETGLDDLRTDVLIGRVIAFSSDVQSALQSVDLGLSGWSRGSSTTKSGSSASSSSKDPELERLKSIVALRKQQLSFLEESGASTDEQVAKMREIQSALEDQGNYMRTIKHDEKDIVALGTEWWSYQNKITKALEEADDTLDRLKDSLDDLKDEEEREVAPLQKQLDILKAQRDAIEDARTEQERILAVEQARIALENAQNDRRIRQYNKSTGQWEWIADAQAVKQAREALAEAEKSLDDYYRDKEIAALESNIQTIRNAYSSLRTAIENFAKEIEKGTLSYSAISSYLAKAVSDMNLSGSLSGKISAAASAVASSITSSHASGASLSAVSSAPAASSKPTGNGITVYDDWGGSIYLTPEQVAMIPDHPTYGVIDVGDGVQVAVNEDGTVGVSKGSFWASYDNGGILHGMGGIKATSRDEMVLPPSMTAALLNAEQNGSFDALLGHLGIVTAAANSYAGYGGSITSNRIGTQNNGDSYNFGNISLTDSQARGMSVYDLAQMARGLQLKHA